MKYLKERKWIKDKMNNGQSQSNLLNCVGLFSNKNKKDIMKKKNLSEKQYKKRYNFLANVYYLLSKEKF